MRNKKLVLNSTADCKAYLEKAYPSASKKWKRISKRDSCRTFDNGEFSVQLTINAYGMLLDEAKVTSVTDPKVALVIKELKEVAKAIKHCGDYSYLYYNPERNEVWWTGGDGDCVEPFTTFEEIQTLLKIRDIAKVTIEAECDPHGYGWINLGRVGITIDNP